MDPLQVHHRVLLQLHERSREARMRNFVIERREAMKRGIEKAPKPTILLQKSTYKILTVNNKHVMNSSGGLVVGKSEVMPLRIDIDMDGYKLKDTIMWNIWEEGIPLDTIAEATCRDFELPMATVGQAITKSLKEQMAEYREVSNVISNAGGVSNLKGIRGIIKLDITIGLLQLTDQFEWDLGEERNIPATFARQYVTELGLTQEFISAIEADITEQLMRLRIALLLAGYSIDAETNIFKVNDPDLQSLYLVQKSSENTILKREYSQIIQFTPLITELDPLEVDKIELNRDREARRRRRQSRPPSKKTSTDPDGPSLTNWTTFEPPKTIPTPLTYRGTQHRILNRIDDDEGEKPAATTRTRRSRKQH